jgi:hypothetical protein
MTDQKQNTSQQSGNERKAQETGEQKLAENPNPSANENIPSSDSEAGPDISNEEAVGSEITDGEDA